VDIIKRRVGLCWSAEVDDRPSNHPARPS
jgi:hypothetical protein